MAISGRAWGLGHGPQRILMLAPCPYPSALGTAVCIRAVAHTLAASGHDVDIVTYHAQGVAGVAGVVYDGPIACHIVPHATAASYSGPQRSKWRADMHLWRYARRLARGRLFDVLWGHHVEGILLGRSLQPVLGLPVIGQLHTRLALELPTYFSHRCIRAAGAAAGTLIDRVLPHLVDALIALNAEDAAVCRRHAPDRKVFVRYPALLERTERASRPKLSADTQRPQSPYAIYSGNADAYQNLQLLCEAAHLFDHPLVLATHGATTPFDAYGWPASTHVVRVDDFAQMHTWLEGAHVGVCPRQQPCGYPIKWLNYWRAGLPLVASHTVGAAVFGSALDTAAHGSALWTKPTPWAFAHAIKQALAQPKPMPWTPDDTTQSYDDIILAAGRHYTSLF